MYGVASKLTSSGDDHDEFPCGEVCGELGTRFLNQCPVDMVA